MFPDHRPQSQSSLSPAGSNVIRAEQHTATKAQVFQAYAAVSMDVTHNVKLVIQQQTSSNDHMNATHLTPHLTLSGQWLVQIRLQMVVE